MRYLVVFISIFLEMLHVTKLTQNLNFFYQNIVTEVYDLPEHNIDRIKTKSWSVCEKYVKRHINIELL